MRGLLRHAGAPAPVHETLPKTPIRLSRWSERPAQRHRRPPGRSPRGRIRRAATTCRIAGRN